MAKKRNVVYLKIAYRAVRSPETMFHELDFINDVNLHLMVNHRLHDHALTMVKPTLTKYGEDFHEAVIHLKFPIRPKGDEHGQYSYSGLHALLVGLSEIYAKHKPNFDRLEFYLDTYDVKTPWVICAGPTEAYVHPDVVTKTYTGDLAPSYVMCGYHGQITRVEQMTIVGETRTVDNFDRCYRRYAEWLKGYSHSPNLPNRLIPESKAQIYVMYLDSQGDRHIAAIHSDTDKLVEANVGYVMTFGAKMIAEPLAFTNGQSANGLLYPGMQLMSFSPDEQIVAE